MGKKYNYNCQITGSYAKNGKGFWQDTERGGYDESAHVRLPEWLIRLICDRYREWE